MDNKNVTNQTDVPQFQSRLKETQTWLIILISFVLGLIASPVLFRSGYSTDINSNTNPEIISEKQTETIDTKVNNTQKRGVGLAYTTECNLKVIIPENWSALNADGTNSTNLRLKSKAQENFEECGVFRSPDYKTINSEMHEGVILGIAKIKLGTESYNGTIINSIADYITELELMQDPTVKVQNLSSKTIGNYTGQYFEYSGFKNSSNFVALANDSIYIFNWDADYKGEYKNDIEIIVGNSIIQSQGE